MTQRSVPLMASLVAYASFALALSVQAAGAIWWAGVVDARLGIVEREVGELRSTQPGSYAQLQEALRKIAVLEERFVRVEQSLDRILMAVERRP